MSFTNWNVKSSLTKLPPPRQRLSLNSNLMIEQMFYSCGSTKKIRALLSVVTVVSKVNLCESTLENVPQSSGAEVEFHVCNYRTTGCKRSI